MLDYQVRTTEEPFDTSCELGRREESFGPSLDGDTDLEGMLRQVTRSIVPAHGDLSIVDVTPRPEVRLISATYRALMRPSLIREARLHAGTGPDPSVPVGRVVQTGRPLVLRDPWTSSPADNAPAPEYRDLYRRLEPRLTMIVPLRTGRGTIGAITVAFCLRQRTGRGPDVVFLQSVADAWASAIDHACRFDEACQAILQRDTVLSMVSHDLRGPLGAIRMIGSGLKRDLEQPAPLRRMSLVDALTQIDASAQEMADQIDDLTDAARLRAGQPLLLHRQPIDLVALARKLVAAYERRTDRHRILLESSLPELVGTWDLRRIERVVANLLSNAIKFTFDAGDIVVRVLVEERAGARWAVLQVEDPGIGIPAADLPRVFSWFFRARNVVHQVDGTGIGLAGARQIVVQHGGTIEVDSEEGLGSTFRVYLPLDSPN